MRFFLFFIGVLLFAYEARVEPFEVYNIKSAVSGKVVFANRNLEAKNVKNRVIVKIDDANEKIELLNAKSNLKILENEYNNLVEVVKRKEAIYKKYQNLSTKSQMEKDLKFFDYINSYNQLLSLKNQINSTKANIKKLKDIISKKSIKVNGYVEGVFVKRGDYVMPGSLVAKVDDLSKEKLTIYVPIDKKISKKSVVYINGKKSNFKVYKIWKVPDSKYITSYKVEIVGKGLKVGEIVRVELKDK